MGFFSDFEPQSDEFREPEPKRVKWRGDPDDTIGIPLATTALLVHTDDIAIVASGFFAYPAGFTFSLVSVSRLSPSPSPMGFHPRQRGSGGGGLRFGIEFADGSKALGIPHWRPTEEPYQRTLRMEGGGGGGRTWRQGFWCEPLPPPGPMALVCEWPDFLVPETSIEIDATTIAEAGPQALALWPDDAALPENGESSPRRRGGGWSTATYRKQ